MSRSFVLASLLVLTGCVANPDEESRLGEPELSGDLVVFFGPMVKGDDHHHHDAPSTHGMLAVGRETLFLSHLPMFHAPHDYQALFEAELGETASVPDPMATYVADRDASGEPVYTIVPSRFSLPTILDATEASPFTFTTEIDRGHFERGGVPIVQRAPVTIRRVIHFRKLDPEAPRPSELTYILFGRPNEAFLAHYITTRPDFDQMLEVSLPDGFVGTLVDAEQLAGGILVTAPGRAIDAPLALGTLEARVPRPEELEGLGLVPDEDDFVPSLEAPVSIEITREVYLEHGDLSF